MKIYTLLKSLILCISIFVPVVFADMHIAITEILKNPVGLEDTIPGGVSHEFIEFVNLGSDTLFLDSLFISDGSMVDSVIPWGMFLSGMEQCNLKVTAVCPGQFAVILDQDYAKAPVASYYSFVDSTVILTVSTSSLVGGLTDTRGMFMYRGSRTHIDKILATAVDSGCDVALGSKVTLTPGFSSKEGFSWVPQRLLTRGSQFIPCPDTVSLGRYEFMQNGWLVEYTLFNPGQISSVVLCTLTILQSGYGRAANGVWSLQTELSPASVVAGTLSQTAYPAIIVVDIPKDSIGYVFNIQDRNTSASFPLAISSVWLPHSPIIINEIFPRADTQVPEWIELLNTSTMPVNLKNWSYGTPEGTDTITREDVVLGPGRYCVLTKSSSLLNQQYPAGLTIIQPLHWQSLDNSRDTLFLINPFEASRCETVHYDYTWFESWETQSLARVRQDIDGLHTNAWALAAKPSPGLPNTGVMGRAVEKASLTIGPIPFSPNSDGVDDSLGILLKLPASQKAAVAIYGFNGRVLYDLPGIVGEKSSWNGRCADGSYAPCGPFFVVATITNGSGKTVIRKKGILWR